MQKNAAPLDDVVRARIGHARYLTSMASEIKKLKQDPGVTHQPTEHREYVRRLRAVLAS